MVGVVRDLSRLARVRAGHLAVGQDDHAGAAVRPDHHAAAELAFAQEGKQRLHVHPRGVELGVHRARDGELVQAVDQVGGKPDHVEDSVPRRDVVVELLQRGLAEDEAARVGGAVVQALECRALAEEDQARRIVGQQPHVTGVALALERREQAWEVDERRLQRVVEDLSRRDRDRFAAVLGLRPVLHAASRLGCFHLSFGFSMILSLHPRLRALDGRRGLRFRRRSARSGRVGGRDELRYPRLDRLVRRQLRLGVELEIALRPVKGADDCVVARLAVALGVEEVSEKEVQRRGLTVPIPDGKGARGPLTLSGLQERSKGVFGKRAVGLQQPSPEIGRARSGVERKLV